MTYFFFSCKDQMEFIENIKHKSIQNLFCYCEFCNIKCMTMGPLFWASVREALKSYSATLRSSARFHPVQAYRRSCYSHDRALVSAIYSSWLWRCSLLISLQDVGPPIFYIITIWPPFGSRITSSDITKFHNMSSIASF